LSSNYSYPIRVYDYKNNHKIIKDKPSSIDYNRNIKVNPTINVNPTIQVNCGCPEKKKKKDKQDMASAFKARSSQDQPITANTLTKILYQVEEFDLKNEYNPATSTFTAQNGGVYLFNPSVNFVADNPNINNEFALGLFVNGENREADNDFYIANISSLSNIVKDTVIIRLNAGDQIEVMAISSTNGRIIGPNANTSYSAARFPSPSADDHSDC
jgi:Neuraminidase (sialidase)